MRAEKKTWQNVLYILILLAAVCLLFRWYAAANSKRIENQNLTYAMDSARQTASRIESEFNNALLRLHNYAYLIGIGENGANVTAEMLKGMEEHASFDAIRFTKWTVSISPPTGRPTTARTGTIFSAACGERAAWRWSGPGRPASS